MESVYRARRAMQGIQRPTIVSFVEAVLGIGRTGCLWRDLPKLFGRWHTVYMRSPGGVARMSRNV
ncbi:transposase [Herbaspirillum camelliae]|uniref:transposase n=1 Tax=Herbaspirillum camelliae TaxID=1892903 RepID=UPI003898EBFB